MEIGQKVELHLSLDHVAVNLTFWSLAAAALFALVAFLGRAAINAYHSRRQDRGILMSLYDDVMRSANLYERGLEQLNYLRGQWTANPNFVPFSRLTKSKYQPLDLYRERLSMLLPLAIYSRVVEFYEEDDHFDAAHAAIFDPSFTALHIQRRLRWLDFLSGSARQQKHRADAVCAAIENRFKYIAKASETARHRADQGQPASG